MEKRAFVNGLKRHFLFSLFGLLHRFAGQNAPLNIFIGFAEKGK